MPEEKIPQPENAENPQPVAEENSVIPKKKKFSNMMWLVTGLVLVVVLGLGGHFLLTSKNKTSQNILPNTTTNESSKKVVDTFKSNTSRSNLADGYINEGVELTSPDGKLKTRYYDDHSEVQGGEGGYHFNSVDVTDAVTSKKTTYKLLNTEIRYASFPIFWSPVDNRIYFLLAGSGIGNYALWSSDLDGSNSKFISGDNTTGGQKQNIDALTNSAIYGAEPIDFSKDGKLILAVRPVPFMVGDVKNSYPIWIMSYDGSNSRPIKLPDQYKNISYAAWGKEDTQIIFKSADKVYITDINGTAPKLTTN